jgi:hypothetical protein
MHRNEVVSFVLIGLLVPAALLVRPRTITRGEGTIAPEVVTVAPAAPDADPVVVAPVRISAPGLLLPHVSRDPVLRPPSPPAPPPPLDSVEPWTGEDLAPQLLVEANARPRLAVDRGDPWDPSVTFPFHPGPGLLNPGLDMDMPWATNASAQEVAMATPTESP